MARCRLVFILSILTILTDFSMEKFLRFPISLRQLTLKFIARFARILINENFLISDGISMARCKLQRMASLVKCEVAKTKRNASKIVTLKCKLITNVIKVAYLLLVKSVKHDCFERHYKHNK